MKDDMRIRFDTHKPNIIIATALTTISCIYYLALLTDGDWNLFGAELRGLVFNDMLAHLLRGEITASPEIVGVEAFLSKGRTVVYWGTLPALLRLPLVPFDALYEVQISRLSCWAAISLVASFLVATLILVYRASTSSTRSTLLFHILVVGTLVSGSVITSQASAYVYNEPIFWAAALGVAFNYIVLRKVLVGAQLRSRDLVVLACLAGLALNCRVLEGIGLSLAMGWVLLSAVFAGREGAGTESKRAFAGAGVRRAIVPATIFAGFIIICGAVNYLRWGSPLSFADLLHHIQIAADPRRLAVLNTFGEFNPVRLPISFAYYFLGMPVGDKMERLSGTLGKLYDGIETPPGAFILTDTIVLILAVLGVRFIYRELAASRPSGTLLVAGMLVSELVAIVLLLTADYVALRYHMDFVPPLSLAATMGYFFINSKAVIPNRVLKWALALTVISIAASHFTLFRYKEDVAELKAEGRLFWERYQCANNPQKCSP
jgi:hypothetical protein